MTEHQKQLREQMDDVKRSVKDLPGFKDKGDKLRIKIPLSFAQLPQDMGRVYDAEKEMVNPLSDRIVWMPHYSGEKCHWGHGLYVIGKDSGIIYGGPYKDNHDST